MATEKVGVYRKWLGTVPKDANGEPLPRSRWPRKRRHRWITRWYGTNGKRYGKVFETRKEAERFAAELQTRVRLNKADRPKKITLNEFRLEHERVMIGQVAYGTVQEHVRALRLFENFIGGSILLSRIRPRNAEAYVAHRLALGRSPMTVNKDIGTLCRIFNLAIEPRAYLAEGQNPFSGIRKRKMAKSPLRYVTVEEYRTMLNESDHWWRTLISIAYGSGLRRNEILNLTWADIDFEEMQIQVSPKKKSVQTIEWEPKDHEKRVVPMADETAQVLANLQAEAEEGCPYVMIPLARFMRIRERQKARQWTSRSEIINNLSRDFGVIRRRAGITKCTLHDLRRSAITNWASSLPIQVVQQLAGHSNISTTREYYLTVRSEDMLSARKVLNGILTRSHAD
jgi:integrase